MTAVHADLRRGGPHLNGPVLTCPGADDRVRWREGERLHHLFEARCDEVRDHLAVDDGAVALTYEQLDGWANRLARALLKSGAHPDDRIGLLLDDPVHAFVAMLAVLKVNAAYVPLDVAFPPGRLSHIVGDAGVRMVISLSHLRDRVEGLGAAPFFVDEMTDLIVAEEAGRLTDAETGTPAADLCYVVYTSGSTGLPKGVPIRHANICNFVRVAAQVYGITSSDRVYQGMTIAFDFSVEEIWVPLLAGATLVPKTGGTSLAGSDLREFLEARRVTALCCVPTLLATLDEDVPGLRFLLVSGEACPENLAARWHRPGRRFLNVYGPTETTVSATWTEVRPGRPVTIGVPLPTYSVVILDRAENRALPPGELGEIGIAGIGVAGYYLNRDDLTDRAFIPDFLGIESNPTGRIYRTGDMGRINDWGEIEYHGRIDTQVKIRGYRVELTEIESVLLHVPGIAQAVVDTYEPEGGVAELVAYYCVRRGGGADRRRIAEHLRAHLPPYMVPAYLEELDSIPMTPSDKADRRNLPQPTRRLAPTDRDGYVAPSTYAERVLAEELAGVLGLERVSVDGNFFTDLGANSLLIARLCARIRQRADLPAVSMKDVYLHPSVRDLAAALDDAAPDGRGSSTPPRPITRVSTPQYVLCGTLQMVVYVAYCGLAALALEVGVAWSVDGHGFAGAYLRAVAFGAAAFFAVCALPVVAKWVLIGRWRPVEIPVWSFAYFRFWAVKTLIRINPMLLFVGSPLYVLYLRALGARIGRDVVIFSRFTPVCTDLLTIGDGTVIRKDCYFNCYQVESGRIRTGRVTLGRDVFVGEQTVLDVETSLGDGAQLGHTSSLHAPQSVPAGERWHGSPAQPTSVDYRVVLPADCARWRGAWFSATQLLGIVLVLVPLLLAASDALETLLGSVPMRFSDWTLYGYDLARSFTLELGVLLFGLAFVFTVPRLLALALVPGRVYPLYGLQYSIQRAIARLTNVRAFTHLFGDSVYIVNYLQCLGYDLGRVEQTGSNFGVEVKHETPYLSSIGRGTMVSDGLSIINADFSSTSFRVTRASVGSRSYLGNNIAYPAGGRTGDNCLLATKVMVPLDGPIRENVGLLGSPCFEIPRSVERDRRVGGVELRRNLAAKTRYNTVTMAIYLLVRCTQLFGFILIDQAAALLYDRLGSLATMAGSVLALLFWVGYLVLVECAVQGFRPLRPRLCSIYDPAFWQHERFWKMSAGRYLGLFNGTPFRGLIWRLLGVRLGKRLFDDGCAMPEKSLVAIGDDCTLNEGCFIQAHSLEDGVFKSDRIVIGDGCTVGVNALVHYGVTMGDGAALDADSFLMKGSVIAPGARWRGNPAMEIAAPDAVDWASNTRTAATPPSTARRLARQPAQVLERRLGRPVAQTVAGLDGVRRLSVSKRPSPGFRREP